MGDKAQKMGDRAKNKVGDGILHTLIRCVPMVIVLWFCGIGFLKDDLIVLMLYWYIRPFDTS